MSFLGTSFSPKQQIGHTSVPKTETLKRLFHLISLDKFLKLLIKLIVKFEKCSHDNYFNAQ